MKKDNLKKNRALYLDADLHLTLQEREMPEVADDEVLVRIRANGICGSDIHFFREGRLGNFVVDRPYVPGHEASGEIVACGQKVAAYQPGDAVVIEPGLPCGHCPACRGGRYNLCPEVIFLSAPPIDGTFCDYLAIRADAVWRKPEGLSFLQASLAEPAAVAVHAIQRAKFRPGANALVLGAGPIGLLVAQAFRAAGGGPVTCVDPKSARLELSHKLGFATASVDDPAEYEVVFDTSGSAQACASLFAHAKAGGCAVQVGWPAGNVVAMDVALMIEKELDFVAVNRYANAFPTALQWLADGRIQAEPLITHTFTLSEAVQAFEQAADSQAEVIKAVVIND